MIIIESSNKVNNQIANIVANDHCNRHIQYTQNIDSYFDGRKINMKFDITLDVPNGQVVDRRRNQYGYQYADQYASPIDLDDLDDQILDPATQAIADAVFRKLTELNTINAFNKKESALHQISSLMAKDFVAANETIQTINAAFDKWRRNQRTWRLGPPSQTS